MVHGVHGCGLLLIGLKVLRFSGFRFQICEEKVSGLAI
jgi:hypothetical protein